MREPVPIHSHVGYADETSHRALINLPRNQLANQGWPGIVHVKVKHLLPHGEEIAEMALLPGVFLRDLQFDRFASAFESTEQRRNRFAHLEIDWAVFDRGSTLSANWPSS